MFNEANYEGPEFYIPGNGMNQFISPDILPPNFCYLLENIIPSPAGVGQCRYGTDLINTLGNPEFNIVRSFPFVKDGNIEQGIFYIAYYSNDSSKANVNVIRSDYITFDSNIYDSYIKNTKIKIVYIFNGASNTLYSDIKGVSIVGNNVRIDLENNLLPDPNTGTLVISQIWCQFGSIYSYDFSTRILELELDGLSIACVPRCAYFQQVMLICNGVNNVLYWDGENLNEVSEFLVEIFVNNFTRIDNNNFSFNSIEGFNQLKYFDDNIINLKIDGVSNLLTISNCVVVGNLVTITTDEALPAFVINKVVLFYKDKPPAFSYIYIAKDRIWALGPGAVSLDYRNKNEQLVVYHSYRPNSVTGYGLFNENTKTVPLIDMSDKYGSQDNFEAICQVNGFMAFIGRNHTQVWGGNTPGNGGDFVWSSNLPVGIFNGELLIELANDVYFVSQSGIQSFSTLNIAKQFSASPDEAVDPIVKKFISQATYSNSTYRKCTSFKYEEGTIAGFKIGSNKILASLFSTKLYSWFYLSGDFSLSSCFMQLGKKFYMFFENKIFKYADGNDGSRKIYGDQGGDSLIPIVWTPGLIKFRGRKGYANKRYELILNYPSSFTLNEENIIGISIFGDIPKSFSLTDKCEFQSKGDLLGEEPLTLHSSPATEPGFRLRKEYEIVNKRLKFVSSSFWLSISGYVINGPITFRRIRLFGTGERNG